MSLLARLPGLLFGAAGIAAAAWGAYRVWPPPQLPLPCAAAPPVFLSTEGMRVSLPGRELVAEVGRYGDEFFAYLMFDYLRGAEPLKGKETLLGFVKVDDAISYPLLIRLDNDLVAAIPFLARLEAEGLIAGFDWRFVGPETVAHYRRQSHVFQAAYSLPVRRKLENMGAQELTGYLRRFLRFKSVTDGRVRKRIEPVPMVLSRENAWQLAADMITVARFYEIPLEFFLGIGAMENNYMSVPGDLGKTVWKRRAEKGDVIVGRSRGRVLVLNESSGLWQITRETLRYCHRLYRKETRDYTRLPEHLRPPEELQLDVLVPQGLTTYAGLLFRDLLDRFEGDATLAVAAYNGGPRNPDLRYGEGVELVARYARRMMEQAATLHGQSVAEMRLLAAR